jgi:DNA polymerase-1
MDLWKMDMGVVPMAARMQKIGMLLDLPHFAWFSGYLQEEMDAVLAKIKPLAGDINPESSDEVAELLFEKWEIQRGSGIRLKRTPKLGRYKCDDTTLQAVRKLHPVVPLISEHRSLDKLKGTFIDKLPFMVDANGRIHTQLRLTRVPSGRFSSHSPNLQQIPTETLLGSLVRSGFIAKPGCVYGSFDLAGIELRTAAHLSGDAFLRKLFTTLDPETGEEWDPHTQTASRLFGKPASQIDRKTERYPTKSAGYLILFGGTSAGLSEYLTIYGLDGWTEDRCEEFIKEWFRVYSGIAQWVKGIHSHVLLYGWVEDLFKRRLWCAQAWSTIPKVREEGLRLAQNMPIQGTAAGILKLATARAWEVIKDFWKRGVDMEPLLSLHDELLFEFPDGLQQEVESAIKPCFENCIQLSVPIRAGFGCASDWGSIPK